MLAKDRKSPRDSIKQWLFATSETQPATSNELCAQGSLTRQRNADEKRVHPRCSTESRRKDDSHTGNFEPRWQSTVQHTAGRFTPHTASARPNLHAPLRNLTYASEVPLEERDQIHHPRKRRRTDTRRSPSLEPAATVDLAARDSERDVDLRHSQELSRSKKRKQLATTDSPSPSTSAHLPPSRPPGQAYRKRRRHKTRDDRFTLKAARRTGEHSEKEHDPVRKPRKRRRAEKSGAALVHEFNASNVPQERLTLKGLHPLGLFAKGKASSSMRRRALPDLAFSELNFLNSRLHETVEKGTSLAKDSKGQGSRKADHNTEVSRYFGRRQSVQDHNQPSRLPSHNEQQLTSDHLIDLPQTPFLGFGSSGHKSSSPNKRTTEPVTGHVSQRYDRGPRSLTKSASYLSWSQTHPRTPSSDLGRRANTGNVHRSPVVNDRDPIVFSRPPLRTSPKSTRTRNEGEVSVSRDVHHRNQSSPAALSQGSRTGIGREKFNSDVVSGHQPVSHVEQGEVDHRRGEERDGRAQDERLLKEVDQAQSQIEQVALQSSDGRIRMAKHQRENMPIDSIGSNPSLAKAQDSHRTGDYVDFLLEQCNAPLVNETVEAIKEDHVQHSDPMVRREQTSPPPGFVQTTKKRPPARQRHDSPPQHLSLHFNSSRADLSSSRGTEHRPPQLISAVSQLSLKQRSHPSHAMLASNMNPATPQTSEADSRNAWNMYGHLYDRQREGHPTPWLNNRQLKYLGRNTPCPETPRDQILECSGMYSTPGTNGILEDRANGPREREAEEMYGDFVAAAEDPSKSLPSPGVNSLEELDRTTSPSKVDQLSFDDESFAPPLPNDYASSVRSSFVNNIHRPMVSPTAGSFSPDLRRQHREPVLPWRTIQRRPPSSASDTAGAGLEGFWKPNKLY